MSIKKSKRGKSNSERARRAETNTKESKRGEVRSRKTIRGEAKIDETTRSGPPEEPGVGIMDKILLPNSCYHCGEKQLAFDLRIDVIGLDEKISVEVVCDKCGWSIAASGSPEERLGSLNKFPDMRLPKSYVGKVNFGRIRHHFARVPTDLIFVRRPKTEIFSGPQGTPHT